MAITVWFGLILQFYLSAKLINEYSRGQNILHYFSYFTIITNLLVAFASTAALVKSPSRFTAYLVDFRVVSAITLYIIFVSVIYHIALSSVWNPQGLQLLADNLLHYVSPAMFAFYWIIIIRNKKLSMSEAFWWLIYPMAYFAYAILLGKMTGFYPYYFINVKHIGYVKLGANFIWLLMTFLVMGLLLIGISKLINIFLKK